MTQHHGRPHDERQGWDHGIANWHEQKAMAERESRQICAIGWGLLAVILVGYLAWTAWTGESRIVNGLLYAVWERVTP